MRKFKLRQYRSVFEMCRENLLYYTSVLTMAQNNRVEVIGPLTGQRSMPPAAVPRLPPGCVRLEIRAAPG